MALAIREKGLRVQGKRSNSGCQICKARHVKCDEGRPSCQRCTKASRTCTYSGRDAADTPRKFVFYVSSQDPSLIPDMGSPECRALDHFRSRTAFEILGTFSPELWSNYVLQRVHQTPSIRYSALALSTMHEMYWRAESQEGPLYDKAMNYYNKAIGHVSRTPRIEQKPEVVLLSCIMFCTIESLRGNFHQSLRHAYSGLQIVAEQRRRDIKQSSEPSELKAILSRLFLALQAGVREFGDPFEFRLSEQDVDPDVDGLSTPEDALHYLIRLWNEFHAFMEFYEGLCKDVTLTEDDIMKQMLPKFSVLSDRADRWNQSVDGFLQMPDAKYKQTLLILKIYQPVARIFLESFQNGGQLDAFGEELRGILDLIESFLASEGSTLSSSPGRTRSPSPHKRRTAPIYALGIGVLPVLFMLSWRCNIPEIRERALGLLRDANRREGVYDSGIAYHLALQINTLQTTRMQSDGHTFYPKITDFALEVEKQFRITYVMLPVETPDSNWVPTLDILSRPFIQTVMFP
jgi:hypothetical protein